MFFVYILYSEKADSYYTGQTAELNKRIEKHNKGLVKSTKGGRPWKLVYSEACESRSESMIREQEIKRKKSRSYIEKLIIQ